MRQLLLLLLKLADLFLNRAFDDQLDNLDVARLTDSVSAVGCLILRRQIPPWIVMNDEIVLHVFVGEERQVYNLEKLWGDLPRVEVQP